MIRKAYNWTLTLARKPNAMVFLGVIAFLESFIFPIPPDIMMVPMMLADRTRIWLIAHIATICSIVGAILGYLIGRLLFDSIAQPLLMLYGYGNGISDFQQIYQEWGMLIVLGAAFTPFPFKIITIASGAAALEPATFVLGALTGRGLRFYSEAVVLWRFGSSIQIYIEKYLNLLSIIVFIILLALVLSISDIP